ncbi:MAG: potassium channel family protein [Planctomycetota bacterium]
MTYRSQKTGISSSLYQTRATRTRRIRVAIPLLLFTAIIAISTIGYILIERPRFSFLDALYMTMITISTAGHREVHLLSSAGQIWTIVVIISGVLTGAIVLSLLGAMVVEGQIRRIFGRRQLENRIKNLSGHVIICGYGRMGEWVAAELKTSGQKVVIVDDNPDRTVLAEAAGLLYVLGDAQSESTLEAAGIDRASQLIAALSTDAENVFVTLTARQLNPTIPIIVRALGSATQDKLIKAGATRVVCPQIIGASRVVDIVMRPAVVDFFDVAHKGVDLEMDQIELDSESELVGRSLKELELPRRIDVHVVAVQRADGETSYHPLPEVTLAAGDTLILIGKRGAAAALQQLHL